MTVLARTFFRARRQAIEWWGLIVVVAFAYLMAMGQFSATRLWSGELLVLTGLAVYAATLGRAVMRELGPVAGEGGRRRAGATLSVDAAHEIELGLLLVTGVYILIVATGGLGSFLYPLVYALVSFLLIVNKQRWIAGIWLAATCVLEILVGYASGRAGLEGHWGIVAMHLTYLLFFAAGNLLVLTSLARRLRGQHAESVSAELARVRQEARDFRLIASQLPLASRAVRSREEEELRMGQGAVQAIHEQLFFTIDLLSVSLELHTAALLWVEADDEERKPGERVDSRKTPRLVIKEMATASEMVIDTPTIESPGVLAAVLRDPKPLRLKSLGGRRLPPYYQGPEPVTDLCAVPLTDGKVVRGFLCADRIDNRPFSDLEQEALIKAGSQCLRIIEQERAFAAVERGKYEQEQFYRASELLNQALTLEDVYAKTFAALGAMAPYELAVITRHDAGAGVHEVIAVRCNAQLDQQGLSERELEHWRALASSLEAKRFRDGVALVSMAIKNRHHMPANGEYADTSVAVFDPGTKLDKARSVLVLPLVRGEQVLGTVTLVSSRAKAYPPAAREMLRVISHQVGVSLQNARMYESMEERATTDGLTGLTNHRAFQERLEHLHALAERTGQKFSIILTDIDHFKSVNDTYGHPVGDAVLKRVAAIFTQHARKVDIVARYGGEEFVLVLPDTDGEGAAVFANRLREEIAAQSITSDNGSFSITLSLGVAEFPGDGLDRHELIEKADQALYYCKEHGRNRVTRVRDLP
ncbi:diguanylate cyclase/phosphodiesterase [Enhygromyxa salina]|uniref:diguanylate cyclase n=1 Tax=Enhygromyxa salina TaxID=215803 RepID=A0A0C2D393_9BACT|nr:sensor domain-containing diguanylate cyclase [Enhygromyxa salina]KIG16200.1 diguanylate cyclase/phosphodiesterase [Enhygromyxa salina]